MNHAYIWTHRDYPWHCIHNIPVRSSTDWDKTEEDQLFVRCDWSDPPRPDRQADRTYSTWRIGSKWEIVRAYAALRFDIANDWLLPQRSSRCSLLPLFRRVYAPDRGSDVGKRCNFFLSIIRTRVSKRDSNRRKLVRIFSPCVYQVIRAFAVLCVCI